MCVSQGQIPLHRLSLSIGKGTSRGGGSDGPRFIEHDYHDHANDAENSSVSPCRGGIRNPFPKLMHQVLDEAEKEGFGSIVSWQPHGRSFIVHTPKVFEMLLMPKYFSQCSKLSSFQRQLNLYGFKRITQGPDKGGYYHEYFLRGRADLACFIKRQRVKGTQKRGKYCPASEPNFYAMKFVGSELPESERSSSGVAVTTDEEDSYDQEEALPDETPSSRESSEWDGPLLCAPSDPQERALSGEDPNLLELNFNFHPVNPPPPLDEIAIEDLVLHQNAAKSDLRLTEPSAACSEEEQGAAHEETSLFFVVW